MEHLAEIPSVLRASGSRREDVVQGLKSLAKIGHPPGGTYPSAGRTGGRGGMADREQPAVCHVPTFPRFHPVPLDPRLITSYNI